MALQLSIIVPLYDEVESLPELNEIIASVMQENQYSYEIIYVDDGSRDGSLQVLETLHAANPDNVKVLSLRRNFGKSAALHEGFAVASGTYVVTMDADLQDDPREIPALLAKLEEGYDMVSGWKRNRQDPFTKKIPYNFFNKTTALVTGIKLHDFNCGLKAYRNEVVKVLEVYGEMHRYLPVLANWNGFRVSEIPVQHHPRKFGVTKFGLSRFFNGFFDLLTVIFITRFNKAPLHFFGFSGLGIFAIGFVILLYFSMLWFLGEGIGQRPLFFLGILALIVGAQFIFFGLLGEMLSHHFNANKEYPLKNTIGLER
jgi:glycosyltransferase involved in cell wall biosynthesis